MPLAACLATALVGAFLVWYRATMHNFPWDGDPARLSICGRDYYRDDRDTSKQQLRLDGINFRRLFPVYRAPIIIGPRVYANASASERAAPRQSGEPCAGVLVIHDAPDRYMVYRLSGGPVARPTAAHRPTHKLCFVERLNFSCWICSGTGSRMYPATNGGVWATRGDRRAAWLRRVKKRHRPTVLASATG
jgi:hypothetical protein